MPENQHHHDPVEVFYACEDFREFLIAAFSASEGSAKKSPKGVRGLDVIQNTDAHGNLQHVDDCYRYIMKRLEIIGEACEERGIDSALLSDFRAAWIALCTDYPDPRHGLEHFRHYLSDELVFAIWKNTVERMQNLLRPEVKQQGGYHGSENQGGKSNRPNATFTTGELAGAIEIDAQTVRNAMHGRGLTPNKQGDRTPNIGPREVTMIATQRQKMGAKETEMENWRTLIKRIGAPSIGSKPKAKPKTNPNSAT
jgi:hypothetical protein